MRPRSLVDGLVLLCVVLLWVYSVGLRLPYMDQVPVYDADATTSEAHMWARIWSDEGAFKDVVRYATVSSVDRSANDCFAWAL